MLPAPLILAYAQDPYGCCNYIRHVPIQILFRRTLRHSDSVTTDSSRMDELTAGIPQMTMAADRMSVFEILIF